MFTSNIQQLPKKKLLKEMWIKIGRAKRNTWKRFLSIFNRF